MTALTPDGELLASYAFRDSETAFGALVQRHAAMVFATAVRQVGQSELAEEVTQNTFLALARKAPRLSGNRTLAGWLHRTALLEAKACIRKELRHRRREETAAALAGIDHAGDSPVAHLMPCLDEALLNLREEDRQVLILRFLEGCSLREVGATLGVAEDAARKRVSRALERVESFFRQRGFVTAGGSTSVPAVTATSVLTAASVQSTPASLSATAIQTFVASSLSKPSFTFAGINVMAINKTQATVAAVLLTAAPLAWQWQAQARVERETAALALQSARASNTLAEIDAAASQLMDELLRAESARINAEILLAERRDQVAAQNPVPVYQWDNASPLVRVPKDFISKLSLSSIANQRGRLSESMVEVLQLTEEERQRTQESIDRFLTRHDQYQEKVIRVVEPTEEDLDGHAPDELRVFEIPYDSEVFSGLREDLFEDLGHVLGPERFSIFRDGLSDWMPLDEENYGLSTGMAAFNADQKLIFVRPQPGANSIDWRLKVEDRGTLGMGMAIEWLMSNMPPHLTSRLQDWIELAKPLPETIAN